jgi:TatD DNase family protein
LAPMPFRGKRNESAYISHVAQKVALTHNVSLEQVSKQTTENAKNLFGI